MLSITWRENAKYEHTERNDFVIGTNQGKTNAIFVKKLIDLLFAN